MRRIFLTTDSHLGHSKMQQYCGRPRDFEELILKNLAHSILPEDILIHLGDVSFDNSTYWHSQLMSRVWGEKWLVKGNHDKASNNWYLDHGWKFVCESFSDILFGKKILFSHIPAADNGYDINIHGHLHNNLHRHEPELLKIKNDKQLLLAIENNDYQPWLLKNLLGV